MSVGVGVDDDSRPRLDATEDDGMTTLFPYDAEEDELVTHWLSSSVAIDARAWR